MIIDKGFEDRFQEFKKDILKEMTIEEFLVCYKNINKVKDLMGWSEVHPFTKRLELELNPVPPVAFCLTQSDPSGYVKEERFWCWLPEEYGGTGKQIPGTTAGEAIFKAIVHEDSHRK